MQSFKSLTRNIDFNKSGFRLLKRNIHSQHIIKKATSSCYNEDLDNSVLVEERSNSRTVILNRPHVLNALITPMGIRLIELYRSWENDSQVGFVTIRGNGRAFSAGGDVVAFRRLIVQGKIEECRDSFRTFYRLAYLLGTYSKPLVALMNGITMGGGAAISVHGSFRVATDKTVFATPEVPIGLHPDAGASYYLPRLPGHLGEYIGLTGNTLTGEEMLACGLATHYLPSASLPALEERLQQLSTDDFAAVQGFLDCRSHDAILTDKSILHGHRIDTLNKCFSHDTVEEIINAVESEAARTKDEWCISTLKRLRAAPPLSLKISLRSIREGRFRTLEQCLEREFRMTTQAISGHVSSDFCEGVRARLVDKCFTPKWYPSCLEQVTDDMVDAFFAPLSTHETDLLLPATKLREATA